MKFGWNKIWRNECVQYSLWEDSADRDWQRKVQSCVLRTNGPRRLRWRRPGHRGSVEAERQTPMMFRSRPKLNYKASWREETFWNATEIFFFYGRFFMPTKFALKPLHNTNFSLIPCERGKLDPKKISKMLIWCYRMIFMRNFLKSSSRDFFQLEKNFACVSDSRSEKKELREGKCWFLRNAVSAVSWTWRDLAKYVSTRCRSEINFWHDREEE